MDYITPKDLSKIYNKSEQRIRAILRSKGYQDTNWKNNFFWQIPKTTSTKIFDELFK